MRFERDPARPACSSSSRVPGWHFISDPGNQLCLHGMDKAIVTEENDGHLIKVSIGQ